MRNLRSSGRRNMSAHPLGGGTRIYPKIRPTQSLFMDKGNQQDPRRREKAATEVDSMNRDTFKSLYLAYVQFYLDSICPESPLRRHAGDTMCVRTFLVLL